MSGERIVAADDGGRLAPESIVRATETGAGRQGGDLEPVGRRAMA